MNVRCVFGAIADIAGQWEHVRRTHPISKAIGPHHIDPGAGALVAIGLTHQGESENWPAFPPRPVAAEDARSVLRACTYQLYLHIDRHTYTPNYIYIYIDHMLPVKHTYA